MATVSFGRLIGGAGFSKTVAVKSLHAELAHDRDFVAMFLDEVRIAARIQHPNVVSVLDVVQEEPELFLVMEYVEGEVLSRMLRKLREDEATPQPDVGAAIIVGVLRGLHAAHVAKDEDGTPLDIIHRDVSPHNIIVGCDGIARVLDFGVAKVAGRLQSTKRGHVKGKLGYMSPEQIADDSLDHRADIYSCGVVLYEALTGVPLRDGSDENTIYAQVVSGEVRLPSEIVDDLPAGADEVVLKALAKDPEERFATAAEMADELERVFGSVSPRQIGDWVEEMSAEMLDERREARKRVESDSATDHAVSNPGAILDALPPSAGSGPTSISHRRSSSSSHSKATLPTVKSIPSRERRSNRRLWILGAAALMLGGAGAVYVFKANVDDTTVEAPTTDPSPAAASLPSPPVEAPKPAPTVVDAPDAPATSAAPSASVSSAPAPDPAPKAPYRPPAAKANCDPPYVITKEGLRRYKIECL